MTATSKERQVINYLLSDFESFYLACCKPTDDRTLVNLIHKLLNNSKDGNNLLILLPESTLIGHNIEIHKTISRILKTFDDEYNADSVWLDLSTLLSLNGGSRIIFRSGLSGVKGETFKYMYTLIPREEVLAEYKWLVSLSSLGKNVLITSERWSSI